EGRFPFLDHRLYEFAAALPDRSKLRGLKEKDILRRWAKDVVPKRLAERPKQPYRAPDVPAFFGDNEPEYVTEMLSPDAILKTGVFDPRLVAGLLKRCRSGKATGFRENQALVAILSTQLWHHGFMSDATDAGVPAGEPDVHLTELDGRGALPALRSAVAAGAWGAMRMSPVALSEISDAEWSALSSQRIFFGHQSVGRDIMLGVERVPEQHPEIALALVRTDDPAAVDGAAFIEARIGRNREPATKTEAFLNVLGRGFGDEFGVLAMYKFCYVDINRDTDPEQLFSEYAGAIEDTRDRFPGVTIVHFTMPLMT